MVNFKHISHLALFFLLRFETKRQNLFRFRKTALEDNLINLTLLKFNIIAHLLAKILDAYRLDKRNRPTFNGIL